MNVMLGSLLLIPDMLLFALVASLCFVEVKRAQQDPDAATSSAGTEMRRRIQILLLVANVGRCLCLIAEAVLYDNALCPNQWTCAMIRCIPDLLFLTTYSMLILFFAQLSHTATGTPFLILRPAFFISNALLYFGFLLVVLLSSTILSRIQVLEALFWFLGSFYLLATFFLLKYGIRMMRFSNIALPSVVLRRLIILCTVCSSVFLLHVIYFLGVATGALPWPHGYPEGINAYVYDALMYPLLELSPSIAILITIHKKKGHPSPSYPYMDNNMPYTQLRNGGPQSFQGIYLPGQRLSNSDQFSNYGQVVREGSNGVGIMGLYSPFDSTTPMTAGYQASA